MFDTLHADPDGTLADDDGPFSVPLERLEAQICELAGHLAAATCRFLVLLGDFDARRGWASWDMNSCAEWLSWKCQMSSGTAREHVRVARALRNLPVIRGEFGAGRLSYAKVRALTRIATPGTEAGLVELAGPMTGNQLERFARAHRQVSAADDADARVRRRLAWRFEEDGSLAGTFRLPPLAGAVLLKALRAAAADREHPHEVQPPDVSAETPPGAQPPAPTSSSLADALLVIAEAFLAEKATAADDSRGLSGHRACRYRRHGSRRAPCREGRRFRGNAGRRPGPVGPAAGPSRGPGTLSRRGRSGYLRDHGAGDRLLGHVELDAAQQRRETARLGPAAPPAQRGAAPRGPRTRQMPMPLPRLRIPPGRPAPHPVLVPRRPHQPGQPDQPVQVPPHARPRPRVPDRRRPRRYVHFLPARRHRHPGRPAPAATQRHDRGLPRR